MKSVAERVASTSMNFVRKSHSTAVVFTVLRRRRRCRWLSKRVAYDTYHTCTEHFLVLQRNPGLFSLTDIPRQNHHAAGEARSNNSGNPPQPAPEPRVPTFERYPPYSPSAPREWAPDAEGQHLRALWQSVNACEGQPPASRPGFLPFVTAVTHVLQATSTTGDRGDGARPGRKVSPNNDVSCLEATAAAAVSSALPDEVVRCLAEAVVLSASVCRCGSEMAGGGTDIPSSSSSPGAIGCPTHGFSAVSWARIIPSGNWRDGAAEDTSEGGGDRGKIGSARVSGGDTSCSEGGDTDKSCICVDGDAAGRHCAGGAGTSHRRACLVATLRALAAACRWRHTREELARQGRGGGGGVAKALALLCDALCARVTELRRRKQGPFRRSHIAGSTEADR